MTGPEHLSEAADCLDELAKARRESDWAKVSALAAAAEAHTSFASTALEVASAPAAVLAGRQGQQWLDAAGVERQR
ncbi:hypothetical protein E1286_05335 [Nonomuraea terrae]|uniref:Uncharacterized protein n=1 Tax=Nonomuraea terrae TaxID=2530383 RepID=A0A4R4Z8S3_9ACTN|nr:hypothetical protein [Nonomuraea terrae]TDD54613.1 hypothetical protein E1286_05335 [Nonomuraea terrae]